MNIFFKIYQKCLEHVQQIWHNVDMNNLEEIVNRTSGETREALTNLVKSLASSVKEIRIKDQKIDYLASEVRLLRKKLFGASSEKSKEVDVMYQTEGDLFNEFELSAQYLEQEFEPETKADEEPDITPQKRKGRKPLPKDLPRKIVEHDLSDEEKVCGCGSNMKYIGTTTSEELVYQPATMEVIEHHCKKYGCPTCNEATKKDPLAKAQIKSATKPLQIIPKSFASPSLLSTIVVQKFCDHLPLYRQEHIFKRLSIELPRQTMSQWMLKVGEAVTPLVNLMQDIILEHDVSFCDETTLQVLHEPGRKAQTKSYIWCFIGGPVDQRVIIYQYHPSRKGDVANDFYEGYEGALHCDGYGGYDKLLSSENIVGINCMAHVRRKFIEALPNGKEKGVSGEVVRRLRTLYQIEAKLKAINADTERIKEVRQEKSKPLLEDLKQYLDEKSKSVLPSSKVSQAIKYTLKRWQYLVPDRKPLKF